LPFACQVCISRLDVLLETIPSTIHPSGNPPFGGVCVCPLIECLMLALALRKNEPDKIPSYPLAIWSFDKPSLKLAASWKTSEYHSMIGPIPASQREMMGRLESLMDQVSSAGLLNIMLSTNTLSTVVGSAGVDVLLPTTLSTDCHLV